MQTTQMLSKSHVDLANQIFDLGRKLDKLPNARSLKRHVENMRELLETGKLLAEGASLVIEDPTGSKYNETRLDCECVGIAGELSERLVVAEVIKPLLRYRQGDLTQIVQRAVIVAQAESEYRLAQLEAQEKAPKADPEVPEVEVEKQFDDKKYLRLCFKRLGLDLSNKEAEKILKQARKR